MLSMSERLVKLGTATHAQLAMIDDVLSGVTKRAEEDTSLYGIGETSKKLRLSRTTIYRLISAGKLKTVDLCGAPRITGASISDFLATAK